MEHDNHMVDIIIIKLIQLNSSYWSNGCIMTNTWLVSGCPSVHNNTINCSVWGSTLFKVCAGVLVASTTLYLNHSHSVWLMLYYWNHWIVEYKYPLTCFILVLVSLEVAKVVCSGVIFIPIASDIFIWLSGKFLCVYFVWCYTLVSDMFGYGTLSRRLKSIKKDIRRHVVLFLYRMILMQILYMLLIVHCCFIGWYMHA